MIAKEQDCLDLHNQGLTQREIAASLGCAQSAVNKHLRRAIQKEPERQAQEELRSLGYDINKDIPEITPAEAWNAHVA